MLHVAWLGDSQVMLVRRGQAVELMKPHKPDREVRTACFKSTWAVFIMEAGRCHCDRGFLDTECHFLNASQRGRACCSLSDLTGSCYEFVCKLFVRI